MADGYARMHAAQDAALLTEATQAPLLNGLYNMNRA